MFLATVSRVPSRLKVSFRDGKDFAGCRYSLDKVGSAFYCDYYSLSLVITALDVATRFRRYWPYKPDCVVRRPRSALNDIDFRQCRHSSIVRNNL